MLGFIGVKLILEALHHSGVKWAPEIPIVVSLSIILGTLIVTAVLSLMKSARVAEGGESEGRRGRWSRVRLTKERAPADLRSAGARG